MDQLSKSKKAVIFIGQFLATALMYGVVLYLLDLFFESDQRYSFKTIAIQSVVFGFLFTLWSTWSAKRKKKEDTEKN